MLIPVPPSECMRAREAASGRLDDELTELESVRLDVHLRRCPACREFAAQAAAVAAELRGAPLAQPAGAVWASARRRRTAALRLQVVAVAAVAVVAAGSLALGKMVGGSGGGQLTTSPQVGTSVRGSDLQSLREDALEQHLFAMLPRERRQVNPLRNGPVIPL